MKHVPHFLIAVASLTGAVPAASAMTYFEPLALFGSVPTTITIESSPDVFGLIDRRFTTTDGEISDAGMVYQLNDGVDWLTFAKDGDGKIFVDGVADVAKELPTGQIAFLYNGAGGWQADTGAVQTSWSDRAYDIYFTDGSLLAFNVAKSGEVAKSTPLPAAAPLFGIALMGVVALLHRKNRGRVVDQGPSRQLST